MESPAPAEETTIEPLPSQSVPAMMLEEPLNEAVQSVADSLDDSDDDYDFVRIKIQYSCFYYRTL